MVSAMMLCGSLSTTRGSLVPDEMIAASSSGSIAASSDLTNVVGSDVPRTGSPRASMRCS